MVIAEENADDALTLLGKPFELHAPDLLFLKFDNVLCKLIRLGLLSKDDGLDIHNRMLTFPIRFYSSQALREKAFEMALQTRSSIYDCLYLALAEALESRVVTADRKFFLALQGGPLQDCVAWIEDLAAMKGKQ